MKKHFLTLLAVITAYIPANGQASQAAGDAAIAASIAAQTITMNAQHKTQNATLAGLILEQETIRESLDKIHTIEKQTYQYLSNVSSGVRDMYEIVECVDLAINCINEVGKLKNQVAETKFMKTAATTLVSKEFLRIVAEGSSMVNVIQNIVLNGASFDTKTMNDLSFKTLFNSNDKPVNLLNAYERHYIVAKLHMSLRNIRDSLWRIQWQLKGMNTMNFIYGVSYQDGMFINQCVNKKNIIMNNWKKTFK